MKNLPVVSRYEVFKNSGRILKNPLPFHHENFQRFGDTFRVEIAFADTIVFTRNPRLIKHVLQKQHKKFHKSPLQTKDLAKYIGHGLLTSNGEHWRVHRRMVQPAFHKKKLMGLLGIMQNAIQQELNSIQPNKEQDIFPLMGDLAFQVVAQSLFSRDDIKEEMAKLQHVTEANQKMLIKEMRQPYLGWWFNLSGKIKKHLDLGKEGRDVLNTIIEERITVGKEKDDLLDMLLKAEYEDGTKMPRKQLIDELLILFTAGHETTANALSFTLFSLAQNEDVQEKAFQEISKIDVSQGDIMATIASLPYIKQCIEEGMRLYPPAYIIDRIAVDDDEFEGQKIPKDMMILLSVYELHRYADFWDAPNEYRPERFNPENKKDFSDYYFPFGAGPRMCVGNNFAIYEMVLTVAEILKKYKLQTNRESVVINPLISLKPEEVPLVFIPRK